MDSFKFSEGLLDKVQEKLVERIVQAVRDDDELTYSVVRHGFTAVEDMDGNELMDEYMNWFGMFDDDGEFEKDPLMQQMINERNTFLLEKNMLESDPRYHSDGDDV